jgi:PhnB protein
MDGGTLMASDTMAGQPYDGMHGFSLTLVYPTAADARRIFDALGQGGRVTMPIQKTFWAEAFGMLVDRFGTPWMVNGAMMSS